MPIVGSKEQVYAGAAHHTRGGLTKAKLKLNKKGAVVSKAKSAAAKRAHPHGPGSTKKRRGGYYGAGAMYSAAPYYVH